MADVFGASRPDRPADNGATGGMGEGSERARDLSLLPGGLGRAREAQSRG